MGVLGRAPAPRGVISWLTSVSGLTCERGDWRHGWPYWVFSRILVMGPDAELPVRALHAEVLDPLLLGDRAEAWDLDMNGVMT